MLFNFLNDFPREHLSKTKKSLFTLQQQIIFRAIYIFVIFSAAYKFIRCLVICHPDLATMKMKLIVLVHNSMSDSTRNTYQPPKTFIFTHVNQLIILARKECSLPTGWDTYLPLRDIIIVYQMIVWNERSKLVTLINLQDSQKNWEIFNNGVFYLSNNHRSLQ